MRPVSLEDKIIEAIRQSGSECTTSKIVKTLDGKHTKHDINVVLYQRLMPGGRVQISNKSQPPTWKLSECDTGAKPPSFHPILTTPSDLAKVHTIVAIELSNVHDVLERAVQYANSDDGVWLRGYTSSQNSSLKARPEHLDYVLVCGTGGQKFTPNIRLIMDVSTVMNHAQAARVIVCSKSNMLSDFATVINEQTKDANCAKIATNLREFDQHIASM